MHDLLPLMLPIVSVPTLRFVLPIFDFAGLCEPLHAHVQVGEFFSPSILSTETFPVLVHSLLDRAVISWLRATSAESCGTTTMTR